MGNSNAVYEIVTKQVIAAMESGTCPWHKPWTSDWAPRNFFSGHPYRGVNWLALGITTNAYGCPFFATRKQIEEAGGAVKKGEKYHPIYFWKTFVAEDKDDGSAKTIPFLRFYQGYNLAQTEGIEYEAPDADDSEPVDIDVCETVVMEYTHRPEIDWGQTDRAFYNIPNDRVGMPPANDFDSPEFRYQTLFHELVHSTGHPSRLHRFDKGFQFGSEKYGREELVAELGAAMLLGECGVQQQIHIENSAAYLRNWIQALKDDPRAVVVAAGKAQKAVDLIRGRHLTETRPDWEA